jgi:hypothetical protein
MRSTYFAAAGSNARRFVFSAARAWRGGVRVM